MEISTPEQELIEVRDSPVHGKGVFARQQIFCGNRICQYHGEIITKEEMLKRSMLRKKEDSVFVFDIDGERFLDATNIVENNPARYINHSCDENCEVLWNPKTQSMEIFSRKNIAKGEELSFDYGFTLQGFFEHPCHCGSKNCVHYIVARDLRPALIKKLLRHPKKITKTL